VDNKAKSAWGMNIIFRCKSGGKYRLLEIGANEKNIGMRRNGRHHFKELGMKELGA
jgi:hypothetical protein